MRIFTTRRTPMSNYLVVKPAYGRSPNSKKAIKELYNDGKDFQILSVMHGPGRYISKTEVEKHNLTLEIRYGKNLEKVMILP
jgi:hypothetical protein